MPEEVPAQHGDSDQVVINPNVDKLDAPGFRGGIAAAFEAVQSGEVVQPQGDSASTDQRSEETPADSRGSDDDLSGTDDDLSDASEIWDDDQGEQAHALEDDRDEDGDRDQDADADDGTDDDSASELEDDIDEQDQDADSESDYADDDPDDREDDDEGERVEEKLTAKERREIQKDPRLRKLAASLNKHATEQYMRNQQLHRELQAQEADQREFLAQLDSPDGFADFLAGFMKARPDVGTAAFNKVLTGEEQVDVLVEIALANPKAADKATEQVELLRSDKGAMANHRERVQLKMERQQLQVQRNREMQRKVNREAARLEGVLEREISRARIPKDYHERVTKDFRSRMQRKVDRQKGTIQFGRDEIRDLVRDHRDGIERDRKYALRVVRREQAQDGRRKTKRKATRNRNRRTNSAPRSRAPNRAAPSKGKRGGRPKGMGFEQMIQHEVMKRIP